MHRELYDNELSLIFQWIWLGVLLVVVLPCTVVSILSMVDYSGVQRSLQEVNRGLDEHKSKPFFELHGIQVLFVHHGTYVFFLFKFMFTTYRSNQVNESKKAPGCAKLNKLLAKVSKKSAPLNVRLAFSHRCKCAQFQTCSVLIRTN